MKAGSPLRQTDHFHAMMTPSFQARFPFMTHDVDVLKTAFRDVPSTAMLRRQERADRTRREALSPVRILLSIVTVPVVTVGLTVSIFAMTSDFERQDAVRHLIAMAGCDVAAKIGMSDMARDDVGYHPRNDPDGDGLACDTGRGAAMATAGWAGGHDAMEIARPAPGAKFVSPK